MFPITRGEEAATSFSDISFQARPVVSAAHQNNMNLVPVQLVMQKLVQPQMSQTDPTLSVAAIVDFSPIVLAPIPILSTLSPSAGPPSWTHLGNICMDRGRGLIPVSKQAQTVPASLLLPPIITPSSYSAPGYSVVHTPPFKLQNQALTQTNSPVPPLNQILPNAASKTACATQSGGLETYLEPISNAPQRPNIPDRRKVEDAPGVLQTLAQRKEACKNPDAVKATVSTPGKSRQGEEDALVLCNGKVFKKSSLMLDIVKSNSASQFHTTKDPSLQNSDLVTPQTKPVYKCVLPRHSHKIISLCEDDSQGGKTQKDDEDVLFVSYLPPKSECGTSEDLSSKKQRAPVKKAEQTGMRKLHNIVINPGVEPSPASGAAGANVKVNEESNAETQQSPAIQQVKCVDADLEQEPQDAGVFHGSSSRPAADMDFLKEKSSVDLTSSSCLDPESCQRSDGLLREMFGIRAGVGVSLQRISPWSPPAELHHGGILQETTFRDAEEPGTQIKAPKTKGARKRRAPGKSCRQTAKKKSSDTPNSDGFFQAWSEDFDDLKSYEEIIRLKKLLKEGEAALERIRKGAAEAEN